MLKRPSGSRSTRASTPTPITGSTRGGRSPAARSSGMLARASARKPASQSRVICRSEEHTSELQSRPHLVCRLLLGKKKHTSELQPRPHLVCRLLLEKKKQPTSLE